ncbi:uncharacterized protein LOC120110979 [Phoenix dactylifera]|uniref:Uncharacterized protein LOC120110979 n=1 Tax=Phoenix dactylifera TaxID=42345 RepID=A0A8B9AB88_PHODC|nr:uncharacterized protein LOC120110979 [Phoenix dactylifera]XP_038982988.1 uncharacterized protein LOC120110979 [Phoenix dactylifera]
MAYDKAKVTWTHPEKRIKMKQSMVAKNPILILSTVFATSFDLDLLYSSTSFLHSSPPNHPQFKYILFFNPRSGGRMLRPSLPLLVKLATAAVTGAAALLAFRRLNRDEAVVSLRREIRDALLSLRRDNGGAAATPPAVLVTGFRAHGKSSFVNTACRALAGEAGPLLLRAETAPPGPGSATLARGAVRAVVAWGEGEEEAMVELVDAPALPEAGRLRRADVEAALGGVGGGDGAAPAAECVVLVLRCGGPEKERNLAVRKLPDIASAIRERGLQFVVVLTYKKAVKTTQQAEELRREVAFRARTDCVYFMENYTSSKRHNISHPPALRNDFETHFTVLAIIRQCIEFVKLYRSHSSQKMPIESNRLRLINRQ